MFYNSKTYVSAIKLQTLLLHDKHFPTPANNRVRHVYGVKQDWFSNSDVHIDSSFTYMWNSPCMFACVYIRQSLYLPAWQRVYTSVSLTASLATCIYVSVFTCQPSNVYIRQSLYLPAWQRTYFFQSADIANIACNYSQININHKEEPPPWRDHQPATLWGTLLAEGQRGRVIYPSKHN